jgi:hypothetical protein
LESVARKFNRRALLAVTMIWIATSADGPKFSLLTRVGDSYDFAADGASACRIL